jgi:hypothetical protein
MDPAVSRIESNCRRLVTVYTHNRDCLQRVKVFWQAANQAMAAAV